MEDKYYIYKHYNLDGEVFYVGKGKGNRATSKNSRSVLWGYKARNGFVTEIVQDNLTEDDAYNLEITLIQKYGRIDNGTGVLVNHTNGGAGIKGLGNLPHMVDVAFNMVLTHKKYGKAFEKNICKYLNTTFDEDKYNNRIQSCYNRLNEYGIKL